MFCIYGECGMGWQCNGKAEQDAQKAAVFAVGEEISEEI
jgi:hypothetical protein